MKKQYQLSEFNFYDGDAFITFNLIDAPQTFRLTFLLRYVMLISL